MGWRSGARPAQHPGALSVGRTPAKASFPRRLPQQSSISSPDGSSSNHGELAENYETNSPGSTALVEAPTEFSTESTPANEHSPSFASTTAATSTAPSHAKPPDEVNQQDPKRAAYPVLDWRLPFDAIGDAELVVALGTGSN